MLRWLLVFILLGSMACSAPDPSRVEMARLVLLALRTRNSQELWDLSTPESREGLLSLHRRLDQARREAKDLGYSTEDADEGLGAWLVRDIPPNAEGAGPHLVARLLDRGFLRPEPWPEPVGTAFAGDEKVTLVTAPSGGFLALVRTPEGWRSALLSEALRTEPSLRALDEAATKLSERTLGAGQEALSARTPDTPWGTFNLMRHALRADPPDLALIYALLSSETHAKVSEAFTHLQKLKKRSAKDRAARDAALGSLGLGESLPRTPADLWMAWAQGSRFSPPLSTTVEGKDLLELGPGAARLIVTSGPEVQLVREAGPAGHTWRIDGYAGTLEERLVSPLADLAAQN